MYDKSVIVDSDFCNMIASGNDFNRELDFFKSIFTSLNKNPVLHTFVYNEELLTNKVVQTLVKEKFIKVVEYNEFLLLDFYKNQYVDTFVDFYSFMNGENITADFSIITKHRSAKNMGEIHSLLLAQYLGLETFMSNDKGAQTLAEQKINTTFFSIKVKNVCDVFCEIKANTNMKQLDKKAVRAILKQRKGWTEIYNGHNFC